MFTFGEFDEWVICEPGDLEHAIVTATWKQPSDMTVVGRWFSDQDGEFQGIALRDRPTAERYCAALNEADAKEVQA